MTDPNPALHDQGRVTGRGWEGASGRWRLPAGRVGAGLVADQGEGNPVGPMRQGPGDYPAVFAACLGPFDRITAWATAPHLPTAWTTQIGVKGAIVAPLALAPVSRSGIGTRIRLAEGATPVVDQVFPAGFVEMHGQELDQWLVPPYGVDVLHHDPDQRAWWLSGQWLRTPRQYRAGRHVLDALITDRKKVPGPLEAGEDAAGFRTWLLATCPDGLTTAALGEPLWRIGHVRPSGAALTDTRTATETITAGNPAAREILTEWATTWRAAGRPGIAELQPQLVAFHDGWKLKAKFRTPAPSVTN